MKKKSFTLVEVIVVVTVMGIVLPAFFTIFTTILRQQLKVFHLAEVKRQGDYVVTVLENTIRNNAYTIYSDTAGNNEICNIPSSLPGPTIQAFKDQYKTLFTLVYASQNLTLTKFDVAPAPTLAFVSGQLNNTKVGITAFSLTCSRGSTLYSAPIIQLSFTICYLSGAAACASGLDQASLTYQTNIKLRNFPTQ